MNSFQDFVNSNRFTEEEKQDMQNEAKNLVDKYARMSQSELQYNLIKEVARQKANGTFDRQKLLFMLNSIKQMLPQQAYEQILNAINNL